MDHHFRADGRSSVDPARTSSRRALLQGAALGGAALALSGVAAVPARATAASPAPGTTQAGTVSLQTGINIALTAEMLAVTTYSNAIANISALGFADSLGVNLGALQGALAAEADHVSLLESMGAQPLATSFNYPSEMFSNGTIFATTLAALETTIVAGYLVGCEQAAVEGRADIAQLAARIAAVEAEHRVNARALLQAIPSNNSSFESLAGFVSVTGALAALQTQGFLVPSGTGAYAYPGPVAPTFAHMVDRRL
jgi:rubrerythrin